jgi:tetratricopeptide (TPR) repeat protein
MADALRQQGDTKAARALYEDIIAAQPATSNWARVALGDILYAQGDTVGAEAQYRAALKAEPQGRDALLGLARVLAAAGDYEGALKQMTAAQPADANGDAALARYATVRGLFDDGTARIAKLLRQNREAYANRSLGREPFYKATEAQSDRVAGLLKLLKSVPVPASTGADAGKAHRKRIFAASLLSQAVEAMLSDLETGKPDADSQATVLLDEFDREMAEASGGNAAG